MKTQFGSLLSRLTGSCARLTELETALLNRFVAELPPELRAPAETQIDAYNLVQREVDGRALNFYRRRGGNVDRAGLPPLPVKPGEVKLVSIGFRVEGSNRLHAVFWAVDRFFFSANFSQDLRPFATHTDLLDLVIIPSWRSNREPDPHSP